MTSTIRYFLPGMGDPGRPAKRNVKLTCYVPAEKKLAIQHEAIDRGMTIGEIVVEAMDRRHTLLVKRHANNEED